MKPSNAAVEEGGVEHNHSDASDRLQTVASHRSIMPRNLLLAVAIYATVLMSLIGVALAANTNGVCSSTRGNYKGRVFPNHHINSTNSFLNQSAVATVHGCRHLCDAQPQGCIALSFRPPPATKDNCMLYNLTNIQKYLSPKPGRMAILLLPVECGEHSSVDGGWSAWSNVSTCSTTCGNGNITQERDCNQPSPYCNGDRCQGKRQRKAACRVRNCTVEFHHDSEERTHVKGFEGKKSYQRSIAYDVSLSDIKAYVGSAKRCEQFWKYESKGSTLTDDDASWTSSEGEEIMYFPSSNATATCYCSGTEDCCCSTDNPCNADANDESSTVVDEGYLTNASLLPVTRLSFGDTGNNKEEGFHILGPLVCYY